MNHRERVIKALNHEESDRVPIDYGGMLATGIHFLAQRKVRKYLGFPPAEGKIVDMLQLLAEPDPKIREFFDADVYPIYAQPPQGWKLQIKDEDGFTSWTDEWGTKYRKPKEGGWWYDLYQYALAEINTPEGLEDFDWPDPRDPGRVIGLEKKVKGLYENTDYALLLNAPYVGIFEAGYFLRGMENWFSDMISNEPFAEALVERLVEFYVQYWDEVLSRVGSYVQVVQIGDDLGGQNGPLFSPSLYRKLFKPAHRKICDVIKSKTQAKIFLHSCGEIYTFLPDIIEVGVDILNPVQVACPRMGDTKKLKREFGSDLIFWGGGCDTQTVLPRGTPEQVEEEVKRRIADLAPRGGFVFTQVHNIQPDVPPENIAAMFKAAKKYGQYPINVE